MCGIIWVFDLARSWDHDLAKTAIKLLKWNQDRWQEWYGLSVLTDSGDISTYKFDNIYNPNIYQTISSSADKIIGIIGHARYPTSWWKATWDEYTQPFSMSKRGKWFAFAFNGNIVNAPELARELTSLPVDDDVLDTWVLQEMILREIDQWVDDTKAIQESIHNKIDGQCNIILMKDNGSFTLAKDRWGFRPVSYNMNDSSNIFTFSSESEALFQIWIDRDDIQHLNTGESVQYNAKSKKLMVADLNLDVPNEKSRCFFESVYFANPLSRTNKASSIDHRYRLWQALAAWDENKFMREDSVVIDVPSSSKDSARWFADSLDLPLFNTVITKNPIFNKRSFIGATSEERAAIRENKYFFNPELRSLIEWKKLIIVDDSIVRWWTLEFLVERIKKHYNPNEIHIRIPSPPITWPCYYAINLKHPNELIARKYFQDTNNPTLTELETLAHHFDANSIRYVDKDQLINALRTDIKDTCLWCVSWKYPTSYWQIKFKKQLMEKE